MTQTIAVTGASGFVGRALVAELLQRGYSVRGLVRSRDKAARALPSSPNLRLIEADILDPMGLAGLVAGVHAVINTVGIIRESAGQTFRKIHVDANRHLIAAAREAGVRRFILISALGVTPEGKAEYQRTKYEGEQLLRKSDLDWTILRPGLIHGQHSSFFQMAKGWCSGAKQPWFFLPYFSRGRLSDENVPGAAIYREPASIQPIAVEDVAWAAAECLARNDSIGEVYNLTGPETLTWPELLNFMCETIPGSNTALNPLGIPSELAAMQAKIAKAVGLGKLLPFDEGMAIMGALDSVAGHDKAKAHLGFSPRGFRDTFKTYAAKI
jgi:NADH dehydrogenase